MNPVLFPILSEDADLLVLHKPAGLVCHPTKGDIYSSLVSRLRLHLGLASEPQLVHRLDRETSGVMIVAKNPDSALALRNLWQLGLVTKEYLAIVHGGVDAPAGQIDLPLGKDESSPIAIKDTPRPDGHAARTRWWRLRRFRRPEGDFSLLRVRLDTGRKHQIRIHLAAIGHPIVGDKLYGRDEQDYLDFAHGCLSDAQKRRLILSQQALHAASLWLPWSGTEVEFTSAPEPRFQDFLEGRPVAWEDYGNGRSGAGPARPEERGSTPG
ncbi:MAG: hypothetical protein RLZ45_1658 [Verrucomicrobiota bacterium]